MNTETQKTCCQMRAVIDKIVLAHFNGDNEKFQSWLNTPNPGLGGLTPMKTPMTELYNFVQGAMPQSSDDCLSCQ